MKHFRFGPFAAALFCIAAIFGSNLLAQVPRGIYVYSWESGMQSDPPAVGCTANCTNAQQLVNALAVNGVDGLTLVLDWSFVEPSLGSYEWQTSDSRMDKWIAAAASLGKSVNLAIRAGGGNTGGATPCWLFQSGCPNYSGNYAGATPLMFDAAAHQGALNNCVAETVAAPWDKNFIAQWEAMLAAMAAHLKATSLPGGKTEWDAVSIVRLTGVNRTTDEFRLPEETPVTLASCGANSINSIQQWRYPPSTIPPYRPARLASAWTQLVNAFHKSFAGKYVNIAIIPNDAGTGLGTNTPQNPFPEIDDNGCVYIPPVPSLSGLNPAPCTDANFSTVDQNAPLLSYTSQVFKDKLSIEFENINNNQPANTFVIQEVTALNGGKTFAAFQTNNWLTDGAACTGSPGSAQPCANGEAYFHLLERGIYLPTPASSQFRSQFLEVFYPDVVRGPDFPCGVWQAHIDLTDYTAPVTKAKLKGTQFFGGFVGTVTVELSAADASTSGQPAGCSTLPITTEYQVDGGGFTTGTSAAVTGKGWHTVDYRSTDMAGNVEQEKSVRFFVFS